MDEKTKKMKRKMAKLDFKDLFTDVHAQQFAMGISCNVPDGEPVPTDKSMIEFIERAGVDMK